MSATPEQQEKSLYHVKSVKNAMLILKSFTEEEPEKTVKELAEQLGTSKSAVSRVLSTMASEGFITKLPGTHRFRLGTAVLSMSGVLTSSLEIHTEAAPILKQLVQKTGETAHLSVLENFHTVYLHKVDSHHPVQTMSHIGKTNPLHCTSSGKLLTAFKDDQFINNVIERGLEQYGPKSITDADTFISRLRTIKSQGYSIDIEEFLPGVTSIAAPVYDYTQKVVAAVNIVGPIQRIHDGNISTLTKQVVQAAADISSAMGYVPK